MRKIEHYLIIKHYKYKKVLYRLDFKVTSIKIVFVVHILQVHFLWESIFKKYNIGLVVICISIFQWTDSVDKITKLSGTILNTELSYNAFPAIHKNCHLLFYLFMYFDIHYCKQYGLRSDCS